MKESKSQARTGKRFDIRENAIRLDKPSTGIRNSERTKEFIENIELLNKNHQDEKNIQQTQKGAINEWGIIMKLMDDEQVEKVSNFNFVRLHIVKDRQEKEQQKMK